MKFLLGYKFQTIPLQGVSMKRCASELCRKTMTMLGCAKVKHAEIMLQKHTCMMSSEFTLMQFETIGIRLFQFTVSQLQDIVTALRIRRNLDLPRGQEQVQENTGVSNPSSGRQKRKLIDFKVNSFQKWNTNTPIPYMFDGRHSK